MNRPSGCRDAAVTHVPRGGNEKFSLTESQECELLEAMAEIERGEFVTLDELLESLRQPR